MKSSGIQRVYAVLLAAGKGRRIGGPVPKQYRKLCGRPILAHTLLSFDAAPSVEELIVVTMEEEYIRQEILSRYPVKKAVSFVKGGAVRQESVRNAIRAIPGEGIVVIQDGVRPLTAVEVIEKCIMAARQYGASAAGMPVKDTIKETDGDGFSIHTPDRSRLWLVQTPQAFRLSLLRKAQEKAEKDHYLGTDDSSLVERLGHPVRLVEGGYTNIKITTSEDLEIAERYLQSGGRTG